MRIGSIFLDNAPITRLFAITKFGKTRYDQPQFEAGDGFLFGRETTGLPDEVHQHFAEDRRLSMPMIEGNRSLNLSNTAAIMLYEAWRQLDLCRGLKRIDLPLLAADKIAAPLIGGKAFARESLPHLQNQDARHAPHLGTLGRQ